MPQFPYLLRLFCVVQSMQEKNRAGDGKGSRSTSFSRCKMRAGSVEKLTQGSVILHGFK